MSGNVFQYYNFLLCNFLPQIKHTGKVTVKANKCQCTLHYIFLRLYFFVIYRLSQQQSKTAAFTIGESKNTAMMNENSYLFIYFYTWGLSRLPTWGLIFDSFYTPAYHFFNIIQWVVGCVLIKIETVQTKTIIILGKIQNLGQV